MTRRTLIIRYAFFVVLASLANLAAQRVVLAHDRTAPGLAVAVATGTAVGLLLKYILDKGWIFRDSSAGLKTHGRQFSRYTAMGAFTTMIFWVTEAGFWLIWQTDIMREVGAVIGLAAGYAVKFELDRRHVFTDAQLGVRATA